MQPRKKERGTSKLVGVTLSSVNIQENKFHPKKLNKSYLLNL